MLDQQRPKGIQVKELLHAGLVASRQEGRFVFYSANYEQMAALMTYLTQNFGSTLARAGARGIKPSE